MTSVDYRAEGTIATIALNRPDCLNAFNGEMRADLLSAIQQAEADDAVRFVILKGNGAAFCSGADLAEGLEGRPIEEQLNEEYKPFLMAIHEGHKLYVAQVQGSAAGIGGSLALTCDLCVMAEDAKIVLAFAAIGVMPDGGQTQHLLNAMGYSRALQTIIEGRKISAAECLELGMVNKIAAADDLENVTRKWVETLAQGAPLSQQATKQVLRGAGQMAYGEVISAEAELQGPLTRSEDCRNAVAAFMNKQKPVFHGR